MTQLSLAPGFQAVRTGSGSVAADSETINDTNYPITLGFTPGRNSPSIAVAWEASGTVAPTDYLDLQILVRVGKGLTEAWLEGPKHLGVRQKQVVRFPTFGSSVVCIRVVAANCSGGTSLIIGAAHDYVS